MTTRFLRYATYDIKRDVFVQEFTALTDELARGEFSYFYRQVVTGDRWEHRKFGRYVLVHLGWMVDGESISSGKTRIVMFDDEVRLDYSRFIAADPPYDAASEAEADAEFDRLDKLDADRLAAKANALAQMKASVNDRQVSDG